MDCKIAGTEKGITGFQLDLKLRGLPLPIMIETIEKARVGRLYVLAEMAKTLATPRTELSKYAPRIVTVKINPEKIGALIGPGGKNIKKIVDESGCEINIEDDGTVNIYSVSEEGMKIAKEAIVGMTAEAEIGRVYRGRVVTIKEFGAFVEFLPGKDGLCHISELANFRVKKTEDIVKLGDEILVKCLGVDEKGRVRLSRREAMADRDRELGGKEPARTESGEPKPEDAPRDSEGREPAPREGAQQDSGPHDSGPRDSAPRESGPRDSGPRDSAPRESGNRDAGRRDSGFRDAGRRGPRDSGPREGGPRRDRPAHD